MEITLDMALSQIMRDGNNGRLYESFVQENLAGVKKEYTAWTDDDFARLREKTGCTMPTQLEALLRRYALIGVGDSDAFLAQWYDGFQSKHMVKTLIDTPNTMADNFFIFRHDKALPDRFPHDMVFFGDADGGHSQLLMSGTDPDDNAVYLWMKSSHSWGEGSNTHGIARCADTLYEFMYNLTTEDAL